jgi:pimeloyl-ACP methyl ester carboxylesterase
MTPVHLAEEFARVNPNARVEILDSAAQLPHEERSGAYNELARDVFTRPPEGARAPHHTHIGEF